MDFDPLSFFEPEVKNSHDTGISQEDVIVNKITSNENFPEEKKIEHPESEDENDIIQLHVLDLPLVQTDIPYTVLLSLLKIFQPDQVKNFGNVSDSKKIPTTEEANLSSYLEAKDITLQQLELLATFLNHTIESTLTLSRLPSIDSSGLTSYLTKIISYPFPTYSEDERDSIYNLTSFVMTANSAPALKGDTTRVVEIDGLSTNLLLYEPAITEDKIGNVTWGASLELAKEIVNPSGSSTSMWLSENNVNNETPILELGAGTGLVTIVLGILGYRVVSTDLPEIIDNLYKNIKLNNLACTKAYSNETIEPSNNTLIQVTSLDWRSPKEFLTRTACPNGYETVILSDPVYSPAHPYWVRDAVQEVLSKSKNSRLVFMVGRRDRFQDVRDCLWNLMMEMGLEILNSSIVDGWDDYGALQYDYKVFAWKQKL